MPVPFASTYLLTSSLSYRDAAQTLLLYWIDLLGLNKSAGFVRVIEQSGF